MSKYTVWHSTGKADGDAGFDDLAAAEIEYESQCSRPDVVEVEIIDNSGDEPVVLVRCMKG